MVAVIDYLPLVAAGSAGYLVFRRLSLPAPAVLGSLFFAGALNLAGLYPDVDLVWVSRCSNIVIGALAGSRVDRSSARLLRELPVPALVVSASMLMLSLGGGAFLYAATDLSPRTAFIGSTTGGIAEMALLAMSLGADVATVTLLQTVRLLTALVAAPAICRSLTGLLGRCAPGLVEVEPPAARDVRQSSAADFAVLASSALAGGVAGLLLGLPAGAMTGAMVGTAAANLLREGLPEVPSGLTVAAQVAIGVTIASNISASTFAGLGGLWLPTSLLLCMMLLCSVLIAELLHRMTGWDYPTCLLSASLGGLSQIAAVAGEMGADPLKVTLLQTVRLLSILLVLPVLFSLLFL